MAARHRPACRDRVAALQPALTLLVAGPLFVATAAAGGSWAWILWVALPGALLPALLLQFTGMRQRGATLEELST